MYFSHSHLAGRMCRLCAMLVSYDTHKFNNSNCSKPTSQVF
jgi:hypothetical protein